eukprot:scaffold87702_cov18-Prasinocladus_malaysianus.AAC.1
MARGPIILKEDVASRKSGPRLARGFRKGLSGSVIAFDAMGGWVARGCCFRKDIGRERFAANVAMIRLGLGCDCESAAE